MPRSRIPTRRHRATLAAFGLALLGMIPATQARDSAPWYQIDLLVFERLDPAAEEEELWRQPQGLSYPQRLVRLQEALPDAQPGDDPDPDELTERNAALKPPAIPAYTLLPNAGNSLATAAARLQRNRNYRLLFQGSWQQPLHDRERADSVLVQGGERFGDHHELEGHVSVGIERFLHLRADLWLSRFAPSHALDEPVWYQLPRVPESITLPLAGLFDEPEGGQESWEDWRAWGEHMALPWASTTYSPVATWRLQESRRMRGEELHYLDHPRLGLLVRLRLVARPDPDTGLPRPGDPLPEPADQEAPE